MTRDRLQLLALKVLRENVVILSIIELFIVVSGLRIVNGIVVPYTNWLFLVECAVLIPVSYFAIMFMIQCFKTLTMPGEREMGIWFFAALSATGYCFLRWLPYSLD